VKDVFKTFNSGRANFFLMVFICAVLALAVLKIAAGVILPFTISLLLAFVMYPLVRWLDKRHVPRFISLFIVVVIIVAGLYAFGVVLFTSGRNIFSLYNKYEGRLNEIYFLVARLFELSYDETLTFWHNIWGQLGIRTWVYNFTISFSNTSLSFLTGAVLVVIFVVFILAETSYFKEKLEAAFPNRSDRINRMGHDLIYQVTRYLTAKFYISLANGVIFAVAFHFIGLEFAIFWGILQFILNFIPNLGSIAGGVIMSLFALIQFWPEPGPVILVVIVILSVNMILGNILDPKIIGEHVGISPVMVLVSLAIWGYIWGFAGMILAVPMTVIIKIVCENIPIMEPVSVLMGTKRSIQKRKEEQEKAEQE
jgi:predicted PurR-regulated permease PerM